MGEIKTRRQTVDFLGFLRSQLSGLQGIPTLCFELIQNADDVKDTDGKPGASKIVFDVCDDALWVENDGVFRGIDFDRMERVSWGNKREEVGTTGAFGIGFISVYQITDAPEIISSGQHWYFHPEEEETKRIVVEEEETVSTHFRLPWAYETSAIRQELGIPSVSKNQLDQFTDELIVSIETAALFLKQVRELEVKRNGRSLRKIQIEKEENDLLLFDGERVIRWKIFHGNFDESAIRIRLQYGELIENKRQSIVKLAIPENVISDGRLYAFLPSETITNLPFHINADFYPSSDRKRILFDQDYKSEWNRLAIECTFDILANQVDDIQKIFTPEKFWEFLDQVRKVSDGGSQNIPWEILWEKVIPQIRTNLTILTSSERMVFPTNAFYLDKDILVAVSPLLEELGINTVHSSLRSYRNSLLATGVRQLDILKISKSLNDYGIKSPGKIASLPDNMNTIDAWERLWEAITVLWDGAAREKQNEAKLILSKCAFVFGSDGNLWSPQQLLKADERTKTLFSKISDVIWFDDNENIGNFIPELVDIFTLDTGISLLEKHQESYEEYWIQGKFSPKETCDWFRGYRVSLQNNTSLKNRVRGLKIWPTSDGLLKDLNGLFLAGDFEDPLNLAKLVDLDEIGGARDFLEQILNVERLDYVTYIKEWVPEVLRTDGLEENTRIKLLEIMSENLGRIRDDMTLRYLLQSLPLIWCGRNNFVGSKGTYFDSEIVKDVLGSEVSIARIPNNHTEAIRSLYVWLGVLEEPSSQDIMAKVREIAQNPPTNESIQRISKIFGFLASRWNAWDESVKYQYNSLKNLAWLPGTKIRNKWNRPEEVYAIFQDYLFKSQGNFLNLEMKIQQQSREFTRFIGISLQPEPELVVYHLLHCCRTEEPVNKQVYTYLTQNIDHDSIRKLQGKACLLLKVNGYEEKYLKPDEVFWEEHLFGSFRYRLGPEMGSYKPLFDKLGVKEKPSADDAISVLLQVADSKFSRSNICISENSELKQVVLSCWRMLSEAYKDNELDSSILKRTLSDKKTIPNTRGFLSRPSHLFFEDRPGWSEYFEIIRGNITDRVEGTWEAMEVAGVRKLSEAITTNLHLCEDPQDDSSLRRKINERENLFQRVIEAHHSKDLNYDQLRDISFVFAEKLEVIRSFKGFGRVEHFPEVVDAVQIDNTLYYCKRNGIPPWISIARELAYVMQNDGEVSGLGMELNEIISKASFEEASDSLDQYGYPRISSLETGVAESSIIQEVGGGEVLDPEHDQQQYGTIEIKGNRKEYRNYDSSTSTEKPISKTQKRKSSRLMSYVYPEDSMQTKESDPDHAQRRNKIGQRGVDIVIDYETEMGRDPVDMETIHPNNPGYDVKSYDINNPRDIRYIEVKSTTGVWDSKNPVQMTSNEFSMAQEQGERYWLYIVEQIETAPKLYGIQDPANKANYFLFDYGWEPIATIVKSLNSEGLLLVDDN